MDVRRVLAESLPQLSVETVETLGRGWDSTAYLVNGELVFRLPDEPRDFAPEVRLLRELGGRLPVAVPDPLLVAPDARFFGYRYLRGEQLAAPPPGFAELWVRAVIAVDASVPPARAAALGLGPFSRAANRVERVRTVRASGRLPPQVSALADAVVEGYEPRFAAAARSRPTTMHADLGIDHWLADDDGRPVAIIDWSDSCIAPVEHELANLWWSGDPQLVADAAAEYEGATGHRPDVELAALDHWANALADVGALIEQGGAAEPVIAHLSALA